MELNQILNKYYFVTYKTSGNIQNKEAFIPKDDKINKITLGKQ